jgi:hypothetical protein
MPPAGFEPTIPVRERLQTHALDRAATQIGNVLIIVARLEGFRRIFWWNSPHFMEAAGPLTCSLDPATCSNHVPDQSSPRIQTVLFKILSNMIHPYTPRSSKGTLTLRFHRQNPLLLLIHATCPPPAYNPPWFDHPNDIWWAIQRMKLHILISFSPLLVRPS